MDKWYNSAMDNKILKGWENVLTRMATDISAVSFDLWLKPLEIVDFKDNAIILSAPSVVTKSQILKNFKEPLLNAIMSEFDNVIGFELFTPEEKEEYLKYNKPFENEIQQSTVSSSLDNFNPKYTFDNFVVGKSNQFVYTACRAVAENPAMRFNPLFIYGGVGLGKTHLLHAIGNYIKNNLQDKKIVYVTCENFINDYVYALKFNSTNDTIITNFREKYRNVDVLMVDDIQFISEKKALQEEFFHTFNDLYQKNKQIIISSDRPPREISALEDRLKSRFGSGLIQDIQKPDLETRIAILEKKATIENYAIEKDAIKFIAEKVDSNIREMEGFLSKVIFFGSLLGKSVATVDEAQEALKNYIETNKESLSTDRIINVVCDYFNVTKEDLIGKKKTKEIVTARQICVYLITEMMDLPLTAIGEIFGGRDHTTIIHSRDKIEQLVKNKTNVSVAVNDLKAMLGN